MTLRFVIPAQAGIQWETIWAPAFAGVTAYKFLGPERVP